MKSLLNQILDLCELEPDTTERMVAPLSAFVALGQARGISLEALGEFVQSTLLNAKERGLDDPDRWQA